MPAGRLRKRTLGVPLWWWAELVMVVISRCPSAPLHA
jgi:hypothetical protein